MKFYIWIISDTVVEQGIAFGFGATKEEAIEKVCSTADKAIRDEVRQHLQTLEPHFCSDKPQGIGFLYAVR